MARQRASLRSCLGTLAWAAFCAADSGAGRAANALPGSADAGRVQKRTETPETPSLGKPPPVVETAPEALPPVVPGQGFVLRAVVIDGATAFPKAELDAIAAPYIGQRVDVSSLNFIAGRITEHYTAKGYLLSEAVVPQQQVQNGVVHIRVVEVEARDVATDILSNDLYRDRIRALRLTGHRNPSIGTLRVEARPGECNQRTSARATAANGRPPPALSSIRWPVTPRFPPRGPGGYPGKNYF
jgi:hemolysin activation/secretion protein